MILILFYRKNMKTVGPSSPSQGRQEIIKIYEDIS